MYFRKVCVCVCIEVGREEIGNGKSKKQTRSCPARVVGVLLRWRTRPWVANKGCYPAGREYNIASQWQDDYGEKHAFPPKKKRRVKRRANMATRINEEREVSFVFVHTSVNSKKGKKKGKWIRKNGSRNAGSDGENITSIGYGTTTES